MESFTVNKIERSKSREETYCKLKSLLKGSSKNINTEMRDLFSTPKLVDQSGCISMDHFISGENNPNAPFSKEDVEADRIKVEELVRDWSGWNDPNKRENRVKYYGIDPNDEKAYIDAFKKEQVIEKSNQLEMAVTILFQKALGQKYVVVRASEYDDYFNGIDNVLVNKETGDVICAFDDFRKSERDEDRGKKKEKKVLRKLRGGGSTLKYGFTIVGGVVQKKTLSSIPVFCLEMTEDDYDVLVNNIGELGDDLNEAERRIFDSLIGFIIEQKVEFEKDQSISRHIQLMQNLGKVESLFSNN